MSGANGTLGTQQTSLLSLKATQKFNPSNNARQSQPHTCGKNHEILLRMTMIFSNDASFDCEYIPKQQVPAIVLLKTPHIHVANRTYCAPGTFSLPKANCRVLCGRSDRRCRLARSRSKGVYGLP